MGRGRTRCDFSKEEGGAHSSLSQPHLPLGPLEPVGELGESGCLGSRWMIYFVPRCSSLEVCLLLPGKAVGSSVEVPPSLPGWGHWQGGALLPHVGWGLLGEAGGWIRSQEGSWALSQGTRGEEVLGGGQAFCFWSSFWGKETSQVALALLGSWAGFGEAERSG